MKTPCEICQVEFEEYDMRCNDSGNYCEPCYRADMRQSMIDAGIPISVIDGKTSLRDHFSPDYIRHMRNVEEELEEEEISLRPNYGRHRE